MPPLASHSGPPATAPETPCLQPQSANIVPATVLKGRRPVACTEWARVALAQHLSTYAMVCVRSRRLTVEAWPSQYAQTNSAGDSDMHATLLLSSGYGIIHATHAWQASQRRCLSNGGVLLLMCVAVLISRRWRWCSNVVEWVALVATLLRVGTAAWCPKAREGMASLLEGLFVRVYVWIYPGCGFACSLVCGYVSGYLYLCTRLCAAV